MTPRRTSLQTVRTNVRGSTKRKVLLRFACGDRVMEKYCGGQKMTPSSILAEA